MLANNEDALKVRNEPNLLITFISEMNERKVVLGIIKSPAEKLAYAVLEITKLYAEKIRKTRGGWICGTHLYQTRTALAQAISIKYTNEELLAFINFCVLCDQNMASIQDADENVKDILDDLLAMRPQPLVHPREDWWRLMYDENS